MVESQQLLLLLGKSIQLKGSRWEGSGSRCVFVRGQWIVKKNNKIYNKRRAAVAWYADDGWSHCRPNVSRKIRCSGSFRLRWRRRGTGDTLKTTKYASGTTKVAPNNSYAWNRRRSQGLIWPARIHILDNCVIFVNSCFFFLIFSSTPST